MWGRSSCRYDARNFRAARRRLTAPPCARRALDRTRHHHPPQMDAFGTVRIQAAPDHWMIDGPIVLAGSRSHRHRPGRLHIIFPGRGSLLSPAAILAAPAPNRRELCRMALALRSCGINRIGGRCGDSDERRCWRRPEDRAVVIVLNHHRRLDWMPFWRAAARLGLYVAARLHHCASRRASRSAPFFGWAMQAFNFSFLSRADRGTDLSRLRAAADHCVGHGDRYALTLFPEGTDLSPSNRDKAKAFAKEKKLTVYQHLLHLAHRRLCRDYRRDRHRGSTLVYDVTVRYDNHRKGRDERRPAPKREELPH